MSDELATAVLVVACAVGTTVAIRTTAGSVGRRWWWIGALAAAAVAAMVRGSQAPVPAGSALAGAGLVAAAVVDAAEGRIPRVIAYVTAGVAGSALVADAVLSGEPQRALRAAALTGALVAACAGLWVTRAMGFGDVRLAAGTATAMLGGAPALVVLGWCGAFGVGLVALARRLWMSSSYGRGRVVPPGPVPFGPPLAVAWLVAVVVV